jgi:hypothetical protein
MPNKLKTVSWVDKTATQFDKTTSMIDKTATQFKVFSMAAFLPLALVFSPFSVSQGEKVRKMRKMS